MISMGRDVVNTPGAPEPSRWMTRRYAIALTVIALLAGAAYMAMTMIIKQQESTGAVVNISGRQRMLSQRTTLFVQRMLLSGTQEAYEAARSELRKATNLIEDSHQGLTRGDPGLGLPTTMSQRVHGLYFEGEKGLDRRMAAFVKALRRVDSTPFGHLGAGLPEVQHILSEAPGPLLRDLDAVVWQYQREGEAEIQRLHQIETGVLLLTLFTLLLEVLFIFRPMVRQVVEQIKQLHGVSETLSEKIQERIEAQKALQESQEELEQRLRDITDRKRSEATILASREAALAASRDKSLFLANMSHEIRTPLNAILGMGEVLEESGLTAQQSGFLRVLTNAGEHLFALINDVLDLSKVEAEQLVIAAHSFDLREVTEGTCRILQDMTKVKGIALAHVMAPDCPRLVVGDPERLRQILLNLIGNAIKFTDQGKIELKVEPWPHDFIRFVVSDTGIGIPASHFDTIFEPFKQVDDSTSRRVGGTGLGLSISRRLVQAMGGTIQLESEVGQGSTFSFTVRLPKEPIADDQLTRLPQEENSPVSSAMGATGKISHILLVEDVENNRMVIHSFLRHTPYEITEAVNGEEGVRLFQTGAFDLVLMDMQMPVLDGFGATEQIRRWEKEQGRPPTPIIALTANAMKEDVEKTTAAGCNLHLSKPVRKRHLLDLLNRWSR